MPAVVRELVHLDINSPTTHSLLTGTYLKLIPSEVLPHFFFNIVI